MAGVWTRSSGCQYCGGGRGYRWGREWSRNCAGPSVVSSISLDAFISDLGPPCIVKNDLEFQDLLPPPPKCSEHRHVTLAGLGALYCVILITTPLG